MLIIADIAGQIDALERLAAQAPPDERIILVGDLVDRGHFSYDVINWAMKHKSRVTTLMGNHEHMMVDYFTKGSSAYPHDVWLRNGGHTTKASYMRATGDERPSATHLDWLSKLPLVFQHETDDLIVTHAPIDPYWTDLDDLENHSMIEPWNPRFDVSILWNRGEPIRRPRFQVFGHNSNWGLRQFTDPDGDAWAVCIDQSRKGILTGFHWPTGEILEETYVRGNKPTPEVNP